MVGGVAEPNLVARAASAATSGWRSNALDLGGLAHGQSDRVARRRQMQYDHIDDLALQLGGGDVSVSAFRRRTPSCFPTSATVGRSTSSWLDCVAPLHCSGSMQE